MQIAKWHAASRTRHSGMLRTEGLLEAQHQRMTVQRTTFRAEIGSLALRKHLLRLS